MDSYQRTASAFHARIDCIAAAVDTLAPGIELASQLLTQAVLEDRKLLVCASGEDSALAQLLTRLLRDPEDGGPPLPAIALEASAPVDAGAVLWRDLRTLSRDGDVLICIDTSPGATLALQASDFAEQRNLNALLLSEEQIKANYCIPLPAETRELRRELLLMVFHSLMQEIRQLLLGE